MQNYFLTNSHQSLHRSLRTIEMYKGDAAAPAGGTGNNNSKPSRPSNCTDTKCPASLYYNYASSCCSNSDYNSTKGCLNKTPVCPNGKSYDTTYYCCY